MNTPYAQHEQPSRSTAFADTYRRELNELRTAQRPGSVIGINDIRRTTHRFSLERDVRPIQIHDILVRSPLYGKAADRYLAAEMTTDDTDIYAQLHQANVHQLPLIKAPQFDAEGKGGVALFRVPQGAKMLQKEQRHDLPSTMTYVGDEELIHNLGTLYGSAWRSTRRLMISDKVGDHPLLHVAQVNFTDYDSQSQLYLCPPYADSVEVNDVESARTVFYQSLADYFPKGEDDPLLLAAINGFDTAIEGVE